MGSNLIKYTTNPNDWLTGVNGLYIAKETPPPSIQGVALNMMGFAGKTVRGPDVPTIVTSVAEFQSIFGSRATTPTGPFYGELWRLYVALAWGNVVIQRVRATDAVAAKHDYSDAVPTAIARVQATSVGTWGNILTAAIENATDAVSTHFNLRVNRNGAEIVYQNLDFSGSNDNSLTVLGDSVTNWVTVTKLATGRPINAVAVALSTGSDGTVAEADYEAGASALAAFDGVAGVLVPEAAPTPATFNAKMNTLALAHPDRFFFVWSGVPGNSRATEITAKTTQVPSAAENLVWCWNAAKITDPVTNTLIDLAPHAVMASILSQVDIPVHPGAKKVSPLTAAIKTVYNTALDFGERQLLRDAGIAVLMRVNEPNGFSFRFVDAPTAAYTPSAKSEVVDVREVMWIIDSSQQTLADFVDEEDDEVRLAQMVGAMKAFLQELKEAFRIVKDYDVDPTTSPTDLANNVQILSVSVQLIGHMGKIVLRLNAGTGVIIQAAVTQAA